MSINLLDKLLVNKEQTLSVTIMKSYKNCIVTKMKALNARELDDMNTICNTLQKVKKTSDDEVQAYTLLSLTRHHYGTNDKAFKDLVNKYELFHINHYYIKDKLAKTYTPKWEHEWLSDIVNYPDTIDKEEQYVIRYRYGRRSRKSVTVPESYLITHMEQLEIAEERWDDDFMIKRGYATSKDVSVVSDLEAQSIIINLEDYISNVECYRSEDQAKFYLDRLRMGRRRFVTYYKKSVDDKARQYGVKVNNLQGIRSKICDIMHGGKVELDVSHCFLSNLAKVALDNPKDDYKIKWDKASSIRENLYKDMSVEFKDCYIPFKDVKELINRVIQGQRLDTVYKYQEPTEKYYNTINDLFKDEQLQYIVNHKTIVDLCHDIKVLKPILVEHYKNDADPSIINTIMLESSRSYTTRALKDGGASADIAYEINNRLWSGKTIKPSNDKSASNALYKAITKEANKKMYHYAMMRMETRVREALEQSLPSDYQKVLSKHDAIIVDTCGEKPNIAMIQNLMQTIMGYPYKIKYRDL